MDMGGKAVKIYNGKKIAYYLKCGSGLYSRNSAIVKRSFFSLCEGEERELFETRCGRVFDREFGWLLEWGGAANQYKKSRRTGWLEF